MSGSSVNLMVPLPGSYSTLRPDNGTAGSMLAVNQSSYPVCRTRHTANDILSNDPLLPLNPYYWPSYAFSHSWFGSLKQATPPIILNRAETKERIIDKEVQNRELKQTINLDTPVNSPIKLEERKCTVISKPRSSSDSSIACGTTKLSMNGPEGMTATTDSCIDRHLGWLTEKTKHPSTSPIQMTGQDPTRIISSNSGSLFHPPAIPGGADQPTSRIYTPTTPASTSSSIHLFQPHTASFSGYYPYNQSSPYTSPPRQYFVDSKTYNRHTQGQGHVSDPGKSTLKTLRNAEETTTSPRHLKSSRIEGTKEISQLVHSPYKVPSGKEGSLKHRILRPPSIRIIEPPASIAGEAPLSAPPTHTHREEPFPKNPRLSNRSILSTKSHDVNSQNRRQNSPPSNSQLQYPVYFMKGSIIQLANGQLKHVENLTTDDFLQSAEVSSDLRIDSSTVIKIERIQLSDSVSLGFCVGQNEVQVTVEAPAEHPFFVFNQGWSSCNPERSAQRYGLTCHKLSVGDVCISLTHKDAASILSPGHAIHKPVFQRPQTDSSSQKQTVTSNNQSNPPKRKRRWSAPDHVDLATSGKPS